MTNGSQYIFFRSQNDIGSDFTSHEAIVFTSLDDIQDHFLEFYECLSYSSVSSGEVFSTIAVTRDDAGEVRQFKRLSIQIPTARFRNRNKLFPFIRDVVSEVFQDLTSSNASDELIEQCYVESARDSSYDQSLRALLKDRPTFAELEVKPLIVSKKDAPEFSRVLEHGQNEEVVLLLGSIGAGKSTFIQRFRKVIGKRRIDEECVWAYVNFNKYSDAPNYLSKWVAETIISAIEADYPSLGFGSYAMLKQAYHVEYERLKRGRLAPLYANDPGAFEAAFAQSLENFESDDQIGHLVRLLRTASRQWKRRVFLVFDNADQFASVVQNDVFMLAHRIAQEVGCSLIISLREESYWKNKDHGALSAFHTINFQVVAPRLQQVISKRFRYAGELLKSAAGKYVVPSGGQGVTAEEGIEVFDAIKNSLLGENGIYIELLEKLSPGELRRPLQELTTFLISGHTNINSLLRRAREHRSITVGFHEFFKAIALGDRESFDEHRSDVVNIYAAEGSADGSNLNRLFTMGFLLRARNNVSEVGVGFVRLETLVDDLEKFGLLRDTSLKIISFFNSRRLFETENQDREIVSNALYVRATAAAEFYVKELGGKFAYVDVIVPGCSVTADSSFDILERLSKQIDQCGDVSTRDRYQRLELRVNRAVAFSKYIADEAAGFAGFLDADHNDRSVIDLVKGLAAGLERERTEILTSARKVFRLE